MPRLTERRTDQVAPPVLRPFFAQAVNGGHLSLADGDYVVGFVAGQIGRATALVSKRRTIVGASIGRRT